MTANHSSPSAASSSASPTPSPTALASRAPVAKLTAACALLSADELKSLLGGANSQTTLTAREDAPDTTDGTTSYNCEYGSNGKYPFNVGVQGVAGSYFSPADGIDAIAKAAKVTTHRVSGVGSAGVYYVKPTVALVAVSKKSFGETRTVFVTAPPVVPEQVLVGIAKVVLARI